MVDGGPNTGWGLALGDFEAATVSGESSGVQKRFVRGDTDGDGEVIITDPIAILGGLFLGQELRDCRDAFDVNDDAEVDLSDPIYALQFLFMGGDAIPPPYPFLGPDRTNDPFRCWE